MVLQVVKIMSWLKFDLEKVSLKDLDYGYIIFITAILFSMFGYEETRVRLCIYPALLIILLYNSILIRDVEFGIDKLVVATGLNKKKYYNTRFRNLFYLGVIPSLIGTIVSIGIYKDLKISLIFGVLNYVIAVLGGIIQVGFLFGVGIKWCWIGLAFVLIFSMIIAYVNDVTSLKTYFISFILFSIIPYCFGRYEFMRRDY